MVGAIIFWILIGAIAGGVANLIVNWNTPGPRLGRWVAAIPLGIVGAILGGFLTSLVGIGGGGFIWTVIIATVGAVILLVVYRNVAKMLSTRRGIGNALKEHRLRTFLDVDELGAGHFDEALLETITNTPSFVVLLTPQALDPAEEEDWLRQEISQAIKADRNVVPIMWPEFKFPEPQALPEDMRALRTYQGVGYSYEFFDAMINRLLKYLR